MNGRIVAFIVTLCLLGTHWYAFKLGERVEHADCTEKENVRLGDAAKLAFRAAENNERIRQDNEAKARKVVTSYANEIAAIRTEHEHPHDRLRIPAAVCHQFASAAAPGVAGGTIEAIAGTVALPEEIERDFRKMARDADEVTATARAMQDFDREKGLK